jgi:soluble lytic murein transglycosylase-like protein
MDALKTAGLCALLIAPSYSAQTCAPVMQVSSPSIDRWETLSEAASSRFGVPVAWIRVVMARESAGHTSLHGAPIVSRSGAMGLMQLMPSTWSDMRARYHLGADPFNPHDNILAGTAYLREMFDRYGYPDLFAAYHAGPGRLDAVLAGQKSLPQATKTYLESLVPGAKIDALASESRLPIISKSDQDSLFFVRDGDKRSSSGKAEGVRGEQGLFVPPASPSSPGR